MITADEVLAMLPPADEAEVRMGLVKPILWAYVSGAAVQLGGGNVYALGGGSGKLPGDLLLAACLARPPEAGRGTTILLELPQRLYMDQLRRLADALEVPFRTTDNARRIKGWNPPPPVRD